MENKESPHDRAKRLFWTAVRKRDKAIEKEDPSKSDDEQFEVEEEIDVAHRRVSKTLKRLRKYE